MDKTELLIRHLVDKENSEFPYDIQIGGYTAFNFLRRHCRKEYLKNKGECVMDLTVDLNYKKVVFSICQSLWHILRILIFRPKYSNVFFSFPRLDLVGEKYCDKFSDPFIESSSINDNYIIFENGKGGIHYSNRIHKDKIINTDFVHFISRLLSKIGCRFYYRRNRLAFNELIKRIQNIYGENVLDTKMILSKVYEGIVICNLTQKLLKAIGTKRLFASARPIYFMAAKRIGVKCFEIQHGITYGETILYSGYAEESAIPDLFLEFGNNVPKNVYGIPFEKMINVGWPFGDFIKKQNITNLYGKNDVLIISEPEVSDKILSATVLLAEYYTNSDFYFRPHPLEKITGQQMDIIKTHPNIKLQDNRLNIMIVLHSFNNIIGENSTVLYEALSINKKVGKLYLSQLNPLYLKEEDRLLFWEIYDITDLKKMFDGNINDKPHMSIYSPFNKVMFDSLIYS